MLLSEETKAFKSLVVHSLFCCQRRCPSLLCCHVFVDVAVAVQREVFYEEEHCVVVYDGYPKAKYHLLLLPKKEVSHHPDALDVMLN